MIASDKFFVLSLVIGIGSIIGLANSALILGGVWSFLSGFSFAIGLECRKKEQVVSSVSKGEAHE